MLEHFTLRDGEGNAVFKGEVQRRDLSAIPDEGVPQAELMKQHAVYLMRYVPPKEKPKFITVLQQFGGSQGGRPFGDGFYDVAERYLAEKPTQLQHGRPHTVTFDWENPPTEAPKNWREQRRKKRDEELQRKLGINQLHWIVFVHLFERSRGAP